MTYRIVGLPRAEFEPLFALSDRDLPARSALLEDATIASIHAYDAAHGCFLARVERN